MACRPAGWQASHVLNVIGVLVKMFALKGDARLNGVPQECGHVLDNVLRLLRQSF
jgi:hypothetical protein